MRDPLNTIGVLVVGFGLLMLGWAGHWYFSERPQAVEASAVERERISEGLSVINVQAGAKVIVYPGGDFVVNAADGEVTVVQMPAPEKKNITRSREVAKNK